MALEKFRKQPAEKDWKAVNFEERLRNETTPSVPDTLASITSATATDYMTGAASPEVLGTGAYAPYLDGEYLYFFAQEGTSGGVYKFTFVVTTNNGQVAEKDILMYVVEN